MHPYVPVECDELELRTGDYVYISGDALSTSSDGWVDGTSWLTGMVGLVPESYTERTAESDAWTVHRNVSLNTMNSSADSYSHARGSTSTQHSHGSSTHRHSSTSTSHSQTESAMKEVSENFESDSGVHADATYENLKDLQNAITEIEHENTVPEVSDII